MLGTKIVADLSRGVYVAMLAELVAVCSCNMTNNGFCVVLIGFYVSHFFVSILHGDVDRGIAEFDPSIDCLIFEMQSLIRFRLLSCPGSICCRARGVTMP